MNAKISSLLDIFKNEIKSETLVSLWNTYCKENDLWGSVIYKNTPKVLNEEFPDAASFARLFAYGSVYDYTSDWFVYGEEDIHSFGDPLLDPSPVDTYDLAEWIANGGFCEEKEMLSQKLKEYFMGECLVHDDYFDPNPEMVAILDQMEKENPIDYVSIDWDSLAEKVKKQIVH